MICLQKGRTGKETLTQASMNQAASYWSSIPIILIVFRDWGYGYTTAGKLPTLRLTTQR